ncbi:discoidin domain-containing protein [Phycicoccus sonneratiae]|uniref:Discoidin domain-containing protein n=1 Tax=Phycicoccus sonneratiae TaxID=2807628 RepID=A0ABS2CHE3_9MICO|nr:discoidin domain-containing protein [Phycicoccus sonneraticus]MBM6399291.1 discoidin domain-containing protein [Phycicoccus sonneraticus]
MRHATAVVGVAAVAATLIVSSTAAADPAPRGHRPPDRELRARVVVTTPDRGELLHERAPATFGRAPSEAPTVVVDPTQRFQPMDGFGASITDSSADVLYRLDPAARDQAMRSLFDPRSGIGVSFLRQPVGSSDFTAADEHWTFDDVPPGETDFGLRHFSIARDERQVLPLLRRAKQLNPRLTVLATPWSPPAWMKTGDSLVGGRLKDDPRVYDAYARYLVKFVQAYARAGVPVDYLTVQNEPQNRAPKEYPGTDLPVRQEVKVIEALGPMLRKASPRTKILAYDHNWSTHPDDVATTPPGEDPETDYPYEVLRSTAARWVAGTAYHCYSGDPSAQSALHDAFPQKGIWFTECSGSHGPTDTDEQVFRGTLTWHARNIIIGTTRNWARSAVNWNIALDEHGGPHLGGCDTCTGLLTLMDDGTVRKDAEYYTIGHAAKFVRPGAVRIASTSFGTTGWNGQVMDVAFRNPDGTIALVAHNENDDPRTVAVRYGDRTFEYTLPGGALATFTWPDVLRSRWEQVATPDATATADPAGTAPEDAAAAVDGDASTRWTTGAAQVPGQHLDVDLGRVERFDRVALDSGGNLGDQARGWALATSRDGRSWRTVATGTSTAQLTEVDVPHTRARWLRVSTTQAADAWWSLADVRLYRATGRH